MTSAWDGPITDDHFHVRATGSNVEAARQFERAGGTDLVLVHCPEFGQLPETARAPGGVCMDRGHGRPNPP